LSTESVPHLEAVLQRDMEFICARLVEMLALDEQALTRASQAFLKRDRQLAYSVILRDQDVDALEGQLDKLCLEFIVRHQPAAANLRFVYSAFKIVNALERVGDYAVSVARQVLLVSSLPSGVPVDKFSEIANLSIPMLHNAVQSFVDRNPDLAHATIASEPRVNQVRDNLNADLLELRQGGQLPLEALPPLLTVARRFERVSDQATNICEQALYYATGEDLRHVPREDFRVLFVDKGNDCLSRMAEVAANRLGAKRFSFSSAGLVPGPIDPQTVWFLATKGVDVSHQPSTSVDQIPQLDHLHVMVALSKQAARAFPQRPTRTLCLQWSVPNPANVRGSREEVEAAYERAFELLTNHVRDLVQAILGDDHEPTSEIPKPSV